MSKSSKSQHALNTAIVILALAIIGINVYQLMLNNSSESYCVNDAQCAPKHKCSASGNCIPSG